MVGSAVDTWARDLASEAKEVAVKADTRIDSHEKRCDERHAHLMTAINIIGSRMWSILVAACGSCLGLAGFLIWQIVSRGAG